MLDGKRILVVDNDDHHLRTVKVALEAAKAQPVAVKTAEEALGVLECGEIDLLLTDLQLPQMNGYELCMRLYGDPRHALIPIVATSANPFINSMNITTCPNVVDFLRKPFRIDELIEVLLRVVTGKPGVFNKLAKRRA